MAVGEKIQGMSTLRLKGSNLSVDIRRSTAVTIGSIASAYGSIYLNAKELGGIVDIEETRSLYDEIATTLRELRDPDSGVPIIKGVWPKREVYSGGTLARAPDIIFEVQPGYFVNPNLWYPRITSSGSQIDCRHGRNGIYAAVPEGNVVDVRTGEVSIEDIAPTILACYGLPIPRWMDGRPFLKRIAFS